MKKTGAILAAFCVALTVLNVNAAESKISIDVHGAGIADVLTLLSVESGRNIVADASVPSEKITMRLSHVTLEQALAVLMSSRGLAIRRIGETLVLGTTETVSRQSGGTTREYGTATSVLTLAHADPMEAVKALEAALPAGTVIVGDKRGSRIIVSGSPGVIARAKVIGEALDRNADHSALLLTHVYRLRYLRPTEVASSLKSVLPDTSYLPDDAQNAMIVTGDEEVQSSAAALLAGLDVPSPQVTFEVRVADIRPINEESDVGLQFGGYDLAGQPIAGGATYAFTHNSLAINARLDALISSGHAQILATPKLTTLNNREADLLIGETYPVVYYDARLGGQQVQFVEIGVKLRMTPTIGSDGTVTAELHPEYSAIEGFVGGYPVLTSRRIDSRLRVQDNETIVLGGLIREMDSDTLTKVPGLSSIPIIGKLFQDRRRSRQRDEVIFLITPHIISVLPAKTH